MTVVIGILGLGFLVFFHELGHFIAARLFGVKVEAFSIGMGPAVVHKKHRGTDYRISLVPLGGYCSMKGEQEFREALEKNLASIEGSEDSFYGIHPLKRLVIAFAGPFFNMFFGIVAFTLVAMIGYSYYSAGTKVSMADDIYPEMSSAAHRASMQSGDTILSINGNKVNDFSEIAMFISTHPDEDLKIEFDRDGTIMTAIVHSELDKETGSGKIGIVSDRDSVVERRHEGKSFFPAVGEGFLQTFNVIAMTLRSVKVLFKGINVSNAVSGPVRITSMLGQTVKQGFETGFSAGVVSTLEFLSLISISLFLTNLLPIPVLDGGLILFAFIQFVAGKKPSPKLLYYIQLAGIGIIVMLMLFALFGDILFILKK